MRRLLIQCALLLLIVVGVVAVQAQDESSLPQDPCRPLSNPPDTPVDNSLKAELEHSALQMTASGEYKAALTLFDRIVEENSNDGDVYALRGCLQAYMGEERDAIRDWNEFLDLSDDDAQIAEVERLIAIYEDEPPGCDSGGAFDSQRDARDVIASYNPETAEAKGINERGLAYLCLGYYDLAIRDFARALDKDKNVALFYNNRAYAYNLLGEQEKAIKDYAKALTLDENDPLIYANRGDIYVAQEEYDNALDDFAAALEIDPDYENALSSRADLYVAMGELEKAVGDYTHLIELFPDSALYHNGRGLRYLDLEMYEEARDDFQKAVDNDSEWYIYWFNLGIAEYDLNQFDDAIDAFSEAIKLNPADIDTLEWRGYLYYYVEENGLCVADYTVLFSLDTYVVDNAYNWARRGACYQRLDNEEQAIRDYDHAIDLDPNYALAYTYRGVAYTEQERYEDALDDLNRSLRLDDSDSYAWRSRGELYDAMKEYESALDDFDEALDLYPDYALVYYYRGYTYYHMEDYRRATSDFQTFLDLDPESGFRTEVEDVLAQMKAADS